MHYAVVRRRAKLTAQHRVIYAIPCNTITNNQMQYNAMQYDAMQYHAKQSKTIQYLQYKEIPCNTLFKSFKPQLGRWGLFSQAGWFHMGCNSAG